MNGTIVLYMEAKKNGLKSFNSVLLSSRMKCFALFFQFLIQADASCKLCFLS